MSRDDLQLAGSQEGHPNYYGDSDNGAVGATPMVAAKKSNSNSSDIYATPKDDVSDGSTHFMSVFEFYDCSFLTVIFICNFA